MRAYWRGWLAAAACVLAVLACAVIAAPPAGGGDPDTPGQPKVNLVSDPMAVPAGAGIRFSWVTSDARQGESQGGYQLRVAASPAALASGPGVTGPLVWDSGTGAGAAPGAAYAGPALRAGTRYWWTVRTRDAQGRASQWAAAAQFGTALGAALGAGWDAQPVWARAPAGGKSGGWAFLRGSVRVDRKPVLAATVYAAGQSPAACTAPPTCSRRSTTAASPRRRCAS